MCIKSKNKTNELQIKVNTQKYILNSEFLSQLSNKINKNNNNGLSTICGLSAPKSSCCNSANKQQQTTAATTTTWITTIPVL